MDEYRRGRTLSSAHDLAIYVSTLLLSVIAVAIALVPFHPETGEGDVPYRSLRSRSSPCLRY